MGDMQSTTVSVNMISEGTEISGKISTQNDFRISGMMDGHLEVKGKCIITETGKVTGDLIAHDADISGTVEGAVLTANKLVLRNTANIEGNIYTKTILMEEGAVFQGECRMGSDPVAARKNSQSAAARSNGQQRSSNGTAARKEAAPAREEQKPDKPTEAKKKT